MSIDLTRSRVNNTGDYGPIEPLTLTVLQEELAKLQGTLTDDMMMNYSHCMTICDGFIDELGDCINLSIEEYPDDKSIYDQVFDGLQEVIILMHGEKEDLLGSDGKPRLMDQQESRLTASDRLEEIKEFLMRESMRPEKRKRLKKREPTHDHSGVDSGDHVSVSE
jgi:hypothetical protein